MACIKLDILNDEFAPLKVVYRKGHGCEKSVQGFIRVDPMAEKYPAHNPFNYTMNNPIIFVDPDGREIIVGGSEGEGGSKFIDQLQNLFGGNVKASFTQGGESKLKLEQTGKLSKSQQAAFDILSGYANDTENDFNVQISNNNEMLNFESYDSRSFDPTDFDSYPAGDNETRGALAHYVHFFSEQYHRQVNEGFTGNSNQTGIFGQNDPVFNRSHEFAIGQESKVSGVRTIDTRSQNFTSNTGSNIEKTIFTNYKQGQPVSQYQQFTGGKKPMIRR